MVPPTSTSPLSPAACSAREQLAKSPCLSDWGLTHLLWDIVSRGPQFLIERLGNCTSHLEFEGQTWSVWTDDDYILYSDGTLIDLDTSSAGLEEALKALQWDLGLGTQVIPRTEWKGLLEQGRAEGLKVKYEVRNVTQDDLRKFVLDYCDGRILCDHQVRDKNLLGMVFMPLVLGAFSPRPPKEGKTPDPAWLAQQALTKDIGKEPTKKPPPPPPVRPGYPPPPPPLEGWREPDPEYIKVIKEDIAWDVSSPERLENYLEEIRLHNVGLGYHHEQALISWEAQKAAIDRDHEKALKAHQAVLRSLTRADRRFEARHHRWAQAKARQAALLGGFQLGRLSDLGVVYEAISQAGPRSINGYPIFWSFRVLSRSDWDRARKAIARELERRESMEI